MMNKKYIVYYNWDEVEKGSNDEYCNHHFEGFDTIAEAVRYFDSLATKSKWLLKSVTWQTIIADITDLESNPSTQDQGDKTK